MINNQLGLQNHKLLHGRQEQKRERLSSLVVLENCHSKIIIRSIGNNLNFHWFISFFLLLLNLLLGFFSLSASLSWWISYITFFFFFIIICCVWDFFLLRFFLSNMLWRLNFLVNRAMLDLVGMGRVLESTLTNVIFLFASSFDECTISSCFPSFLSFYLLYMCTSFLLVENAYVVLFCSLSPLTYVGHLFFSFSSVRENWLKFSLSSFFPFVFS